MDIAPFRFGTIESIAKTVGGLYTGSQLTSILIDAELSHYDPGYPTTKWTRIAMAVETQQGSQGDGRPLIRLVSEALDPRNLNTSSTGYDSDDAREEVNQALSFDGYRVREDGTVISVGRTPTLSEARKRSRRLLTNLKNRGAHEEVLKHCQPDLVQNDYYQAAFESIKGLADRLRVLTNTDLDGRELVQRSFGGSDPLLQINERATKTQRNEQVGVQLLAEGVFAAFRNPTAHEPRMQWQLDEQDALDVMGLVSLLHRRVDIVAARQNLGLT